MANANQKKSTPILLGLAGLALVILLVFAIRWLTRTTLEVRVGHVSRQTLESTVSTNGKVEPVDAFQAHASAPGVVKKIDVRVGDHVSAGELLIQMDDTDARSRVATAQSNLTSAQAGLTDVQQGGSSQERSEFNVKIAAAKTQVEQAQANLATEQRLQSQGAASAGEVTAAQQQLSTAQMNLAAANQQAKARYGAPDVSTAQARISDARAAVQAARSGYADVAIHSPIRGTVYAIPVAQYDYVHAGDDLMDVADLNRMQVRAYFDEPEIGKLRVGQPVSIVWDAKPGQVWHGHLQRAPTTVITYGTRNVGEALITVDDAHGDLLPNTNVTVKVTELERPDVLSIPREALHTQGDHDYVFRVVDGKLVQTSVKVGVVTLVNAEVLSGVQDGDTVALGSAVSGKDLSDGLAVTTVQ